MFIEERHQAILDLLEEKGSITTAEIQEMFGVSYDSAKRDLRILEEKGLLKRTHGGAIKLRQVAFSKPPKMTCKDIGEIKDNYLTIANIIEQITTPLFIKNFFNGFNFIGIPSI